MPQQYPDTWHDLEAADERAWLDGWIRIERVLRAAVLVARTSVTGTSVPELQGLVRLWPV